MPTCPCSLGDRRECPLHSSWEAEDMPTGVFAHARESHGVTTEWRIPVYHVLWSLLTYTHFIYASFWLRGEIISAHKHPCGKIALCSSHLCGRGSDEGTQRKKTCAPQDLSSGLLCWWVPLWGHLLQPLCSNKPCPHCAHSTETTFSSVGFCSHWKWPCWEEMSPPVLACSHIPAQHGCPSKAGRGDPDPVHRISPKGVAAKRCLLMQLLLSDRNEVGVF